MNSSSIARVLRAAALSVLSLLIGGCYLMQSAGGHLDLMSKRRPINEVIAAPATPAAIRAQLEKVRDIRNFASHVLKLPDNGSYRSYADVQRPYVVWNVVAAPEFSVTPTKFCYPVVGCVAYRGYFKEKRAQRFAAEQRKAGLDVSLGGVAAYSTLGHFDDPVLNTMLAWDDVELAAIIFHELTHQLIYVANDASFDEAFATTVEEEGVKRWLEQQGRTADLERHRVEQARELEVTDLLNASRDRLKKLYASGEPTAAMRADKAHEFETLRAAYEARQAAWGDEAPYQGFFKRDLNNADLASVATYYVCVPGFERELAAVQGDLPAFFKRVRELAKLDQKTRDRQVCGDVTTE